MLKLRFEILELRKQVTNQFILTMSTTREILTISLLTELSFIYLGISKMSFTSKYL